MRRRQPPNYIITSDSLYAKAHVKTELFSLGFLIFLVVLASARLDDETSHATDRESGRVYVRGNRVHECYWATSKDNINRGRVCERLERPTTDGVNPVCTWVQVPGIVGVGDEKNTANAPNTHTPDGGRTGTGV